MLFDAFLKAEYDAQSFLRREIDLLRDALAGVDFAFRHVAAFNLQV